MKITVRRTILFTTLLFIVSAVLLILSIGTAQTEGGGFSIPWWTAESGGLRASASYTMRDVIGQPDAGQMSSANYKINGGFLQADSGGPPPPSGTVYTPAFFHLLTSIFEQEPNDSQGQANGPLSSGILYYGLFPSQADENDFYYFEMANSHTILVTLENIGTGHDYDLGLIREATGELMFSGTGGNADESIQTGILPAGVYYVWVINGGPSASNQPYEFQANFE